MSISTTSLSCRNYRPDSRSNRENSGVKCQRTTVLRRTIIRRAAIIEKIICLLRITSKKKKNNEHLLSLPFRNPLSCIGEHRQHEFCTLCRVARVALEFSCKEFNGKVNLKAFHKDEYKTQASYTLLKCIIINKITDERSIAENSISS